MIKFSLDGEYKLDEGRRIARRFAKPHHLDQALDFAMHNFAQLDRKEQQLAIEGRNAELRPMTHNLVLRIHLLRMEMALLGPFWKDDMTKEQAVQAYEAAEAAKTPGTHAVAAGGVG
jgi:hypothetical protein